MPSPRFTVEVPCRAGQRVEGRFTSLLESDEQLAHFPVPFPEAICTGKVDPSGNEHGLSCFCETKCFSEPSDSDRGHSGVA